MGRLFAIIAEDATEVGILAKELLGLATEFGLGTLILLEHGAFAKEEIVEVDNGNHQPEEANGTTLALDVEAVVYVHGGEKRVVVVGQGVELVEHFEVFGMGEHGVCRGEHIACVLHESLRPVAGDAVALLDALLDVVVHLCTHTLFVGTGEEGHDGQYCQDDKCNDEPSDCSKSFVCFS